MYFIDIQCDNLSASANGEILSCSSGRVGVGYEGDTCSFTCNTGYELTGSDTRTCQSDGSWNGSEMMCSRGQLNIMYMQSFTAAGYLYIANHYCKGLLLIHACVYMSMRDNIIRSIYI